MVPNSASEENVDDETDDNVVTAWRQLARSSGLLRARAGPPTAPGISLSYLEAVAATVRELQQEGEDIPCSTVELLHHIFLPALARPSGRSRLLNMVPPAFTGPPQWYVCHAWEGSFLDLVSTLQRELAPDPGPTEPPLPPGFKDGILLWIDVFAMSQYQPHLAHVIDDSKQRELAAESDARIREGMEACSEGVLLVVDSELQCLSRAWCMYEVFQAAYTHGCMRVNVALPELPLHKVFQMRDTAAAIDFVKLETYRTQDKRFLVSEVKRRCGAKRTNAVISEALLHALLYKLKWRAKMWETSTLAAVLLQEDKLLQLQLLLSPLPELKDDEQTLSEMRSLFLSFDKDHSGEIDSWEFVEMLNVAGWSAEDALTAFSEVNTDGEGGVSLEEFEQWWLEHLRHELSDTVLDLSVGGLSANLERMVVFMERLQLFEHVQYFKIHIEKVKSMSKKPEQKLPAPSAPLKGDISSTMDHATQGIVARELGPQCHQMYDLLRLNHEMLEQSPSSLQVPNSVTGLQEQAKLLASYLQHLVKMLRYQLPHSEAQYEYVMDTIATLKAGSMKGGEPKAKAVADDPKSFLTNRKAFRQGLRAKYGRDEFVTPQRIKELQKAVSQFIANTRNMPRNVALSHPSPTQMLMHQDKAAAKMRRGNQTLSMGCAVEVPSLADLRTRLRDDVNRERCLELGMTGSLDKQGRTKPISGMQHVGPGLRSRQALGLELEPPALPGLEVTASRSSSLPALRTLRRPDAEADTAGTTPSRANSITLPRSKAPMPLRLPPPCIDDYIDRSFQRSPAASEAGLTTSASASLLLGDCCSPRLKAMSSELHNIRTKGHTRHSSPILPDVRSRCSPFGIPLAKPVDSSEEERVGEEGGSCLTGRPSDSELRSSTSLGRMRSLLSMQHKERLGHSASTDSASHQKALHRVSLPGTVVPAGSKQSAKGAALLQSRRVSLLGASRLSAVADEPKLRISYE